MRIEFVPKTFSASEAAKITGISMVRQREFRQEGCLPKNKGHARFDAYDLAELLFVKKLSDRGVLQKNAFLVSKISAIGIAWNALANIEAYHGNHNSLIARHVVSNDGFNEIMASKMEAISKFTGRTNNQILQRCLEASLSDLLRGTITRKMKGSVTPSEFFIWWADNSEHWTDNIQEAFDNVHEKDAKRNGAAVIISLNSLGLELLEKVNGPLFDVKVIWDD